MAGDDETRPPLQGRGTPVHLDRAIDRDDRLIDSVLSECRDKHAARRFLHRLIDVAAARPLRVTTDHQPGYREASRWILGRRVLHRTNEYLSNLAGRDERAIKQRYCPMSSFGRFGSAARFGTALD